MSLTAEFDLDQCLAELDSEHGKLPVAALRWAQEHREEVIPELIRVIEDVTAAARAGHVPDTNGHFFAFCLLSEFGAGEAWPALLAAMRLPGELPFDLFGDIVHGIWRSTIRTLANDRVDDVLALIRDREVNEYVRWSAVGGLVAMVAWEQRPRDEVVGWLKGLFLEAVAAGDLTLSAAILCDLCDLWPGEAMDDIRNAFDRNLVDDEIIGWGNVEQHHAAGLEATMRELIERRSALTDTVTELSHWASFTERKPIASISPAPIQRPAFSPVPLFDAVPVGARSEETFGTIHRATPRVGRNEPCPCNSGKKFKKCCGIPDPTASVKPR